METRYQNASRHRVKRATRSTCEASPSFGTFAFFRDPPSFEALKQKVFAKVFREVEEVRIWVLGCSSGEEVYSLAIAATEFVAQEKGLRTRSFRVFATDIEDDLLLKARQALYKESDVKHLSSERLRRFFVKEEGGYRISRAIRERIVFARHDPFSEPPFSRMDVVWCRDTFVGEAWRIGLPILHYALKPDGLLFLGARPPVEVFAGLFQRVDKRHRIYYRLNPVVKSMRTDRTNFNKGRNADGFHAQSHQNGNGAIDHGGALGRAQPGNDALYEADRITLSRFAPPGVLINSDLLILQFRGRTEPFLEPPEGKPCFHLLSMARDGLMLPLRRAIKKAAREGEAVTLNDVRIIRSGEVRLVNAKVIPLQKADKRFLILFSEAPSTSGSPGSKIIKRRHIAEVEREIRMKLADSLSAEERSSQTNLELQDLNEVLQSANEELQSISEELEASKAELAAHAEMLEQRVQERTKQADFATQRLQEIALKLLRSQDDERRLIARELHDEIGQQLTGLKFLLEKIRAVTGEEKGMVRESRGVVAELQKQIQTLSFVFRQEVPDHVSLLTVLECHFNELAERTNLKIKFECPGIDEAKLGPEVRHALFRIAQEGLTNVVRHSSARKARIFLSQNNGEISIEISDSGIGFNVETERAKFSSGISGMEERVLLLGGRFDLTSCEGGGTRIYVTLPCSISKMDSNRLEDGTSNPEPATLARQKGGRRRGDQGA